MILRLFGTVLLLSSCASAYAVDYDSGNDTHCYALSLYFAAAVVKKAEAGTPPDQGGISTLVVGQWFREKFAQEEARIGKAAANAQAKPLYEAIGSDFEKSKQSFKACVMRATRDPNFESFAVATLNTMKAAVDH